MGKAYSMTRGDERCVYVYRSLNENLKGRDLLENAGIDRIILKWMLRK
jgi:hypothetical protein